MPSFRSRLTGPVGQFAAAAILAVIVIGVAAFLLIRHAGNEEALRDAKRTASLTGEEIVAPGAHPGVSSRRPGARFGRLDRVVRDRILGHDGIVRVKIWDADVADRLLGRAAADRRALPRSAPTTWPSSHGNRRRSTPGRPTSRSPENRYEAGRGRAARGLSADSRRPAASRCSSRPTSARASSPRRRAGLVDARAGLIGALLVLAVLQLPLAARLAAPPAPRPARARGCCCSGRSMPRSRAPADRPGPPRRRRAGPRRRLLLDSRRRQRARRAAGATRSAMRAPACDPAAAERPRPARPAGRDLPARPPHRAGLARGDRRDVSPASSPRHRRPSSTSPPTSSSRRRAESLFFRGAQESLRNVVAHADASTARVAVARGDGHARPGGRATTAGASSPTRRRAERPLRPADASDLARDAGGRLEVDSRARRAGRGSMLEVLRRDPGADRRGPRGRPRRPEELLESADDIEVVGAAADGAEAIELAAAERAPT